MNDEATLPTTLDFDFTDEQLDAIEVLPNGRYKGEIIAVEAKMRKSGQGGLKQTVRIPPEEYPVDFDGTDYPDGITIPFYFIPWDPSNRPAVRSVRKYCAKIGAEFHSGLDYNDFVGQWAYWDVVTQENMDGDPINGISGCHEEAE